ncbi:MAG TPA: hypothetical protein DCS17_07410 [Flavobacterium sp.]|nr:hypothetical protein [Flavobacterium sp.]
MIGKTIAPFGVPNDIKFIPNPTIYQFTVDRNSDIVTDGSGTVGSLRYCLENCTFGDIIVFNKTLTDTAGSGEINTVKILSALTTKACTIYGNDNWITASVPYNYNLFLGIIIFNSLHFKDLYNTVSTVKPFASSSILNGCKFHRLSNNHNSGVLPSNCTYNNCDFNNISGGIYTILNGIGIYSKCNFSSITSGGGFAGLNVTMTDCYIDVLSTIASNPTGCVLKRCYKTGGDIIGGYMIADLENCIFINAAISNNAGGGLNHNFKAHNNTFINTKAIAYLFPRNVLLNYTFNVDFKNNLIIAPLNTYVVQQTVPAGTFNIVESGNIYMGLNADPLIPNSTRYTGSPEDIISLNEIEKTIDGVKHNYFNPKGISLNSCVRTVLTDYNGINRTDPTDCGAVEI